MYLSPTLLVRRTLKKLNICITTYTRQQKLEDKSRAGDAIELLLELPKSQKEHLLQALHHSQSQFGQDLFVLSELDFMRNGFFVEFGATDGVHLSNTYLLEKEFGWHGIVAEPARGWHKDLRSNRSCHIETDCVWKDSNQHFLLWKRITMIFRRSIPIGYRMYMAE
jgi:hypothetical protein